MAAKNLNPDTIGRPQTRYGARLRAVANRFRGMSTTHFTLVYDGELLREGRMDVRELAPALLSTGELFEEANLVLNQGRTRISVQVQAGFDKGSFDIRLVADQTFLDHLKGLVTGQNVVVASAVVMLLFGGRGLIDFLKWLKGFLPDSTEKLDDGSYRISLKNTTFIVSGNVFKLYQSPKVRQSIKPVVSPLKKQGIDILKAILEDKIISEIKKEEIDSLIDIPIDEKILSDTTNDAFLQIVSPSFKEENKWRLSDGASTRYYEIEDEEFAKAIDTHQERFGKGDILKSRVRTVVRISEEGKLTTECSIVKVYNHIVASDISSTQGRLFPDERQTDIDDENNNSK